MIAPFDGMALEVKARPGEVVAAGVGLLALTDPPAAEVRTTQLECFCNLGYTTKTEVLI